MKINTYYRFCELCFHYGRNWDKLATDKEHAMDIATSIKSRKYFRKGPCTEQWSM